MLRTPGARVIYFAPTLKDAKEIIWESFRTTVSRLGIPCHYVEGNGRCKATFLHNGATFQIAGCANKKDANNYRGRPFHLVLCDEAAHFAPKLLEYLIDQVLGPRMGDYKGTICLFSTPSHRLFGDFYEYTRDGADPKLALPHKEANRSPGYRGYSIHKFTLEDGAPYVQAIANNLEDARGELAKGKLTEAAYQREYLANWAKDFTEQVFTYQPYDENGKPFNAWEPERYLPNGFAELPKALKGKPVLHSYGIDLGMRDPFALTIWAWSPEDASKTLYQVYEFHKVKAEDEDTNKMYAGNIARLLIGDNLDPANPGGLIGHTGWPTAIIADEVNNISLFAQLKDAHGIVLTKAQKADKLSAIALFNGDLQEGKIKILKGSKLEEQIGALQWEEDDLGRLTVGRNVREDIAESALYARQGASHLTAAPPKEEKPFFPKQEGDGFENEPNDLDDYFEDFGVAEEFYY